MTRQVGARASAFAIASMLLVAGCTSDEATRNKVDLGTGEGDTSEPGNGGSSSAFLVTNLASDQAGLASNLGTGLVNAWGIVPFEGMFWIANAGSGKVSIVDGEGKPAAGELVSDAIDLGMGITGVAVNDMADDQKSFQIHKDDGACAMARLIFASTTGKLFGVNPDFSAKEGFVLVDRSGSQAVYLGVAVVHGGKAPMVLAADFRNARIDVFDASFHIMPDVSFVNPEIPENFAPFNVMAFGDKVYVTYAQPDPATGREVFGPGLGYVAAFDTSGKLLWTLKSEMFNAPWGMAVAGKDFAAFPNTLLVGNFGDGHITAINSTGTEALGQLMIGADVAVEVEGLWGITFGEGVTNARPGGLYFAAGPDEGMHGMFGVITQPAAPPTMP